MKTRLILTLASATLATTPALAHHITQSLSYGRGPEVVATVPFFDRAQDQGVPAYLLGNDEFEGTFDLVDGSSIVVSDGLGHSQTAFVTAAQFPDIRHATAEQVLDALAPQVTIADLVEENGFLAIRGLVGGPGATIAVAPGAGNLFAHLDLPTAPAAGEADVPLLLSHFEAGANPPDYAGHPYRIFASTTEGTSLLGGHPMPIRFDSTTRAVARLAQHGALPAFAGRWNGTEDARAAFRAAAIPALFGANPPARIHFAYAIYSLDGAQVLFTSNRFTVEIVH
jgi:hypothetical protein